MKNLTLNSIFNMKIYNEDTVNDETIYEIQDIICSQGGKIKYKLSDGEIEWMNFARRGSSLVGYLDKSSKEDGYVILDNRLSKYLDYDCFRAGVAVCLSHDSKLQMIFFYCYQE